MEVRDELIQALDFSESIVILTDEKGTIRYVNNSFVNKYGFSRDEVYGQDPSLFKSDYHDPRYYDQLWTTIRNGETWRGVFKNRTKEGKFIWEKAVISPVRNSENKLSGYIAVKEDITRQRELEEQIEHDNQFLDELFDNSPVGIAILQPVYNDEDTINDFLVVRANPSAGNVVGKLGIVGLKISEILPGYKMDSQRIELIISRKTSFEAHLVDIGKHVRYRTFPFGRDKICLFFYDVSPYRETIQALEASEERYFTLVEDAPALISRFDKEGVLIYANDEYCKTFEVERSALIGQNIFDWYPDEDRSKVIDAIQSLTAENPISVFEHKLVLKSGKIKWMRWLDRALVDSSGEIFEYQSVGMDLTPLKQTEMQLVQHRNKLDAVVNSTVAGIGVVSPQGRFVLVNERMQKMLGFSHKSELYQKSHIDVTHPMWQTEAEAFFNQLVSGEINDYNLECQFRRQDLTDFWGDLHVSPIKDADGRVIEIIGIVTDITRKKEIEIKLKEREFKLKELNATKDKLFSIIAHDIKNPFNSILGFTGLLKNNLDSYSKNEIESFVEQIAVSSENLYKLLDDLLVWAKSQLGQMTVNPQLFSLKPVVDEAIDNFTILASNKQVHLVNDVSPELMVYADQDMTKFVIRNLIHNGIKFTESNGEVRCSAYIDNEYSVISIIDTGIGIKESKLGGLFEISSYLTTNGTSQEKGTGLGLHLSKDMIEKNDGEIDVKSIVDKGTEFIIYLPNRH